MGAVRGERRCAAAAARWQASLVYLHRVEPQCFPVAAPGARAGECATYTRDTTTNKPRVTTCSHSVCEQ